MRCPNESINFRRLGVYEKLLGAFCLFVILGLFHPKISFIAGVQEICL